MHKQNGYIKNTSVYTDLLNAIPCENAKLCYVAPMKGSTPGEHTIRSTTRSAYFTTLPIEEQDGEHWDQPLSDETGTPYTPWSYPGHRYPGPGLTSMMPEAQWERKWSIIEVKFEGPFADLFDEAQMLKEYPEAAITFEDDTEYKVLSPKELNSEKKRPWVATSMVWSGYYIGNDSYNELRKPASGLHAGIPILEFIDEIIRGGGEVFIPVCGLARL